MKKLLWIFVVGVTLALTACGTGSTTNDKTDSTAAMNDSTAMIPSDSTTTAADTLVTNAAETVK